MLSLQEMLVLMGIATSTPAELPISKADAYKNSSREVQVSCMADNIYFEARNQGTAGWSAVASVTLNRVKDKRFPNTVCEVVKQGPTRESWKKNGIYYPIRHKCQFSWYCDGLHDKPNSGRTWENAKELASLVMQKYQRRILIDITDGATHYHANWMHTYPKWSYEHKKVASIDRHIFYRANTRNGR